MASTPPQWDSLPAACKELRHWVLWKTAMRDGRLTKVPIRADSGLNAESDDLTTWTTFDKVREAFEKGRGSALGVGFVFARSSEISGVDLDHCRDPATGEIDEWAKAYLARLNSYSEISPSGAGLHVLVKGSIPVTGADGGRQKKLKGEGHRSDAAIEMYSAKRFFTMTGNVLPEYPQGVESRQNELMAIYTEVFGKIEPPQTKTQEKAKDEPETTSTKRTVDDKAHLSDEAVIARMLGGSKADEIEKLLKGDTSAYAGDESRADQALCNHTAFWTAKNRQQMDSIFRTSKLMRPKWDEKRGSQTYGEMTIDKAIRDTKEVYQPDESTYQPAGELVLPTGCRLWADNLTPGVPGVDKDGIIYHRTEKTDKKGNTTYVKTKICDGYCCITEETRDEIGEASFTIAGRGSRDGHEFKFDITGRDFSDNRKLKAALVAHFGARNRIKELTGDVIQSLTLDVKKLILIKSPRWIDGRLAIPGLDGNGFKFNLARRVPSDVSTGEDGSGLTALRLIFETWPVEKAAILIAADLASPVCGRWFNGDRFGLALVGTTGRGLKTEALKHVMAIYGAGFLSEETLLRWGDGATTNAMLSIASSCGCLPTGIDNYKATYRDGPSKFVSMVHTVLEGRERERLNRNAELRETREYASTLLVTGEDLPEEASTVARLLPVEWSTPPNFDKLTELQAIANHLPAVGRLWCGYLSSVAELPMDAWKTSRSELVNVAKEAGAVNPGRIGTTIAILKQVWTMALNSPLGGVLKNYTTDFEKGLVSLIQTTACAAEDATEASQFVDVLKELISSGRCVVLDRVHTGQELTLPNVIGWRLKDPDPDVDGVAILPRLAIDAVRRVAGPQAQEVGPKTLYRQLHEAGLITEGSGKGQRLTVKRAGAKTVRVLVFKKGTIMDDGIMDVVDLSTAAGEAAEDIEKRKKAANLIERLKQAVTVE